ncbi:MAG: DUF1501 domain-containing protein [Gemmataceae bacterium]|nr:DUF1501 domain-containing protein [Gemmataceae bacterium]
MNRRHFLSHVAGASAMAVPAMGFLNTLAANTEKMKKENKSLIILWMGGGPTHMDLWDVKDPGVATAGEFKRIKTAASGVEISELLPETAKQFKHLSIVRNLVTNEGSHERGTELMNTGRPPSPIVKYPAIGAIVSSQVASKDAKLPPFIGVGGTAQRIGPGFLGMTYAPFTVQNAFTPPENIRFPASLGEPKGIGNERMRRRQRLFYNVEDNFAAGSLPHITGKDEKEAAALREAAGSAAQAHATVYGKAFDLTVSKLRDTFEVSKEPTSVIDAYGGRTNNFGMGCLLARRLVEVGVNCVEVDLGGWDMHANIFASMRNGNGPRLDKGMGTLTKELAERGLLKNTVVVWMGEFGRTPRINQNGGRDHWGRCWSVVVGGGAIKGGIAHGSTSKDGMDPADKPQSIGDLFATIFKGLGIDPHAKHRDNLGRPIEIADGKPIKELL